MRRILLFLFLLILVINLSFRINPNLIASINDLIHPPCSQPINYKVGVIDPKFNILRQDFLQDISLAAQVWENVEGKDLFQYNPDSKLTINLVYDERQSLISKVNNLEDKLAAEKNKLIPNEQKYQEMVVDFNKRLANLNTQIKYWNEKGGAPENEYNQLRKEQNNLKQEADSLNEMAKQLNKSADNYNNEVGMLNQTANDLNDAIGNKPEEGLFDPNLNKIDIYLNVNKNELIHTLAHELGHSLGLQHVADQRSIMYAFTSKNIAPTPFDIQALRKICRD